VRERPLVSAYLEAEVVEENEGLAAWRRPLEPSGRTVSTMCSDRSGGSPHLDHARRREDGREYSFLAVLDHTGDVRAVVVPAEVTGAFERAR
jgi:hypothetical protein